MYINSRVSCNSNCWVLLYVRKLSYTVYIYYLVQLYIFNLVYSGKLYYVQLI